LRVGGGEDQGAGGAADDGGTGEDRSVDEEPTTTDFEIDGARSRCVSTSPEVDAEPEERRQQQDVREDEIVGRLTDDRVGSRADGADGGEPGEPGQRAQRDQPDLGESSPARQRSVGRVHRQPACLPPRPSWANMVPVS